MLILTPAERRDLRAKAHRLHPVVSVGQQGLTASVLHEIDVNLLAHELIKVRVFNHDRVAREAVLSRICGELEAAPVQHIGKLLVVWRPAPAAPEEQAPSRPQRKGRPARRGEFATQLPERRLRARAGGGQETAFSTAKSAPHARRPREPAPRTPSRPAAGQTRRLRGGQPVAGGRRRRRGAQNP